MRFFSKLISVIMIIPALFGMYSNDAEDTQEAYLEKISQVNFENTVETAIPQTEIYNMITEHYNSPLPEGKTEKKVLLIGYDGCRADELALIEHPDSAIRNMLVEGASLNLAYCGGVNFPAENTQDTSTAPGWCSVLTGVWADKHGITGNGITKSLEYKTLMTTLAENGTINSASFNTSWDGHFENDNSTYKLEKAYCEENGLNVAFNYCKEDVATASSVIKDLRQPSCSDFIFAILEGTDHSGHTFGFSSNNPIYKAGFRVNEVLATRILDTLKSRTTFEQEDWLVIITSDHGGFGTGHGGPTIQERMVFIVANKY